MKIEYFVFTNGEDGENVMDWGVKHSSAALGDRKILDGEYQSLLAEFGMSPSLNDEIPSDGKVNILLLPYTNGRVLLGYVFPSRDHKGRRNSSSVVCVIPSELQNRGVRDAARKIWDSNELMKISMRGSVRPDSLEYEEKAKTRGTYPFVVRDWPSNDTGYLSVDSNIRTLHRTHEESAPEPDSPVVEPKRKFPVKAVIVVVCAALAVVFGGYEFAAYRQRKAESERIAREAAERELLARQEAERIAREESRRKRDAQDEELSSLERRLREAQGYLTDALSAESAKFIASSVMRSIDAIDAISEFVGRISVLRSLAQSITSRADEIIRLAEESRIRQAEEEARKREEAERQRVKRIADSILAGVRSVPEITGFQAEYIDNSSPPSGNMIDTPSGKIHVCRIDDDYSLLDAEALKKALISFCGEEYVSNIPEKYFVFAFTGTRPQLESRLRSLESEIFMNIHSIKPSHVNTPINLDEYITQSVSTSHQHNFRIFFKGEDDSWIIVYVNSSGTPEVYLGTKRNIQAVSKRDFLRSLVDSVEISERQRSIAFYLKHDDVELKTSSIDGKFELFIGQLTDSGGTQ